MAYFKGTIRRTVWKDGAIMNDAEYGGFSSPDRDQVISECKKSVAYLVAFCNKTALGYFCSYSFDVVQTR